MEMRKIGIAITALSLVILGLLVFLKLQTDKQMLAACEQSCGSIGEESCVLDSCPYHSSSNYTSWVIVALSVLTAFIGGTGVYISFSNVFFPEKTEKIIEEKEYDLTELSEEEKEIFLFVKSHKGGVYQSGIAKEFTLSKVRTTRLLDKLESAGLVERKRRGMANMVIVK